MDKNLYAEKLISEYSQKESSALDELKNLDKKVKKPALIFAYVFGSIGALVLGVGMCLAMKIIGGTTILMALGIIIGLVGICMVSINYPLFNTILRNRKSKYSAEIIKKSNELLNK